MNWIKILEKGKRGKEMLRVHLAQPSSIDDELYKKR